VRRVVRRLTPRATTAAVATVVAVRATGAGPMTAALRIRRLASIFVSFAVVFVVGLDGGKDRLDGDAAAADELTA
jgi:hypothetical protein